MIPAMDTTAIKKLLDQHRSFEACLLREIRTQHFGMNIELRLDYIWDDERPESGVLASEARLVTLRVELVREARYLTALPGGC